MTHFNSTLDDLELLALYNEDVPYGDLTTQALALESQQARIEFSARYDICCCGTEEVARMLELKGLKAELIHPSGTPVEAGTLLVKGTGPTEAALSVWKIAQNLMEWSSGIASATQELVHTAHQGDPNAHVVCTRKNTPGTKKMSIKAIRYGGGAMHRLGLSESILIFAEHCQFSPAAPVELLARSQAFSPELNRTVEVNSIEQATEWAQAGVEVLQLEKFTPEQVGLCKEALSQNGLTPLLAAAGGINPRNAAEYARGGADLLVTSWPYQARPKDIQVRFYPEDIA